jgi:hypothetical protein
VTRNRRVDADTPRLVHALCVVALIVYAFALQFSTAHLGSIDGYFHIRYSAIVREAGWRGFPPPFPWLPLTILAPERYFDHHFLFHLWLALFAAEDLVLGAKLAAAIGASVALVTVYAVMVHFRVWRAPWWMLAGLAVAPGFQYRLEMPRVQSWSLACLLIALPLFLSQRTVWLFALGWMFTWLYNAFPFLLAIGLCASAACWWQDGDVSWRPLVGAGAGIVCGLVINPYFPNNLRFILHHYGAKLTHDPAQPVGSEWYPPLIAEWLGWSGLFALLIAAGFALYRIRTQLNAAALAAALAALMFWICYWRATRFIEYVVPFTTCALALTGGTPLRAALPQIRARWRRAGWIILIVAFCATTVAAAVQLRRRPNAAQYEAAAQWLQTHTPPGALVFLADWDDFPLLYFHDTANTYSLGLDPSYLAERDPTLFAEWRAAVEGHLPTPGETLRARFGAVAAFTDHRQTAFIRAMDSDAHARRAFADATGIVYVLDNGAGARP